MNDERKGDVVRKREGTMNISRSELDQVLNKPVMPFSEQRGMQPPVGQPAQAQPSQPQAQPSQPQAQPSQSQPSS